MWGEFYSMIDLERPDWIDDALVSQKGINDYIVLLEKKIIELSAELDKYKENERLTILWARGELVN